MDKNRLSKIISGTVLIEIVGKLSPLIIAFFIPRRLGLSGYGRAQFVISLVEFALAFMTFGYTQRFALYMSQAIKRRDELGLKALTGQMISLRVVHFAISTFALLALALLVPDLKNDFSLIAIGLIAVLPTMIETSAILLAEQKAWIINLCTFIARVLGTVAILLLVHTEADLEEFVFLQLAINVFAGLLIVFLCRKYISLKWVSLREANRYFLEAAPFAVVMLLFVAFERIDIALGEFLYSSEVAGLIAGLGKIPISLGLLAGMVGTILFSESLGARNQVDKVRLFAYGLTILTAITLPVFIGSLFVGDRLVTLLLGPSFENSGGIFSVQLLSTVFTAITYATILQIYFTEDNHWLAAKTLLISITVGFIVAVITASFQIPFYLAAAVCFGRFVTLLLLQWQLRGLYRLFDPAIFRVNVPPALLMAIGLFASRELSLALQLVIGGAAYVTSHLVISRNFWFGNTRPL